MDSDDIKRLQRSVSDLAVAQAAFIARFETQHSADVESIRRNTVALQGNGREGLERRVDGLESGRKVLEKTLDEILTRLKAIEAAPREVVQAAPEVSPWRRFAVELAVVVGVIYSAFQQLKHLF